METVVGKEEGNLSDYRGSRARRERDANPETDASRFNRLSPVELGLRYNRNLTWPRVRMLRVSSDGLIKPGAREG